jgi:phage-related protein/DNA-binding XRE family transcriptional regulator
MRAKFERIVKLMREQGLETVREPYVKHLGDKLREMRLIGRDGIARAIYATASGQRIVVLRTFVKKTDKTPRRELNLARVSTRQGGIMSRKMVPVEESFVEWRKDPAYREAYEALEGEFALAAALIEARSDADISQAEIAKRMHTSQPAVARLEGGHGNPSLNTLRRYAAATGTRLRIVFEPLGTPLPTQGQ